jgi:cytochrome c
VIEARAAAGYRWLGLREPFMRLTIAVLLAFAATPALSATGQDVFNDKCGDCHTVDPPSGTAPALKGVVGRKVASLPDFQYSDALKAKGGVWTEAALEAFIADPKTYAPGTQMTAGAADPADRKAIIDYLKSVK